jgi:hypothetical protein
MPGSQILVEVMGNVPSLETVPVMYAEPDPSTAIAPTAIGFPLDP